MPSAKLGIKDIQTVRPSGEMLRSLPEGVELHERPNIITRNGITAEVMSAAWGLANSALEHIIHVSLRPGAIAGWNRHEYQTDRIFPTLGTIKAVLHDIRADSKTRGETSVLYLSPYRPTLLVIPPGIWHAFQNVEQETSGFLNLIDKAYRHEDPDEYRLPADTPEIPYRF